MSTVAFKNIYASYTAAEWNTLSEESHKELPTCTRMKYVAYTVSLFFNYVLSCLNVLVKTLLGAISIEYKSRWAWWNPIITHPSGATLYLGALPLTVKFFGKKVRSDADALEELGIGAVLSLVEPFENHAKGFFISAVTPEEWKSKTIRHLQISSPDFETIPLDKIDQGVEFIHWNLEAGHSVYGQCKAGRGRSGLIELCYLIKYQHMSAEQALQKLKTERPQVSIGADKWATVKEYEQRG